MLQGIAFYLMAAVAVVSAILVVTARNPVHSVLWLILAFFSSAGLFVLMGAEFLAMLFLFVVMMLDVDFVKLREGYARYLPMAMVVAGVLLAEMIMITLAVVQGGAAADASAPLPATPDASNVEVIGRVLYTDYVYFFQAAGIVLLIAMIGAITLTLRHKPGIKRQNIDRQVGRLRKTAVEVKSAPTGQGVSAEDLK